LGLLQKAKNGRNGQVDLTPRALYSIPLLITAIFVLPDFKWSKKFGPNFTE
jgi:hypothetical protein